MVNVLIGITLPIFPSVSVTFIVQLSYIPSANVLRVMILIPWVALVVIELQLPA